MRLLVQRWGACAVVALSVALATPGVQAHLVRWESHPGTHASLMGLFPAADPHRFKVKHHRFDPSELQVLRARGIDLTPSQREVTFYIAYDDRDSLVGVAIFLALRGQSPTRSALRLGVAVDGFGRIHRIEALDPEGEGRVGRGFLEQLEGRDLSDTFEVDGVRLSAAGGNVDDSRRVAHAGREALVLMQVALGRSG